MSEHPSEEMCVLSPAGWPRPRGYANGVAVSGRLIVLAGQIGWNPVTCAFETDDFALQVRQSLANIVTLLHAAGAEPRHLVRLTWFITDRSAYVNARREIGEAYRALVGPHYPPMSVVIVSGLVEERARVEIEGMAVVPVLPVLPVDR
jgi:enamine deaminase RidA (YjgF/YER057c/UK114 family)